MIFLKKHQGELLQTPRCFGHNTKVFAPKTYGVFSQNIRCFASNTKVFFFGHSCFCEKPVSPSLIRFFPFLLFVHKVALFFAFCLRFLATLPFSSSMAFRFLFVRPCECLIPALFVCLWRAFTK